MIPMRRKRKSEILAHCCSSLVPFVGSYRGSGGSQKKKENVVELMLLQLHIAVFFFAIEV